MERIVYKELIAWKHANNRKPLFLRGARQVGKTWLMKTFGQREYKKCIYLNFENNVRLKNVFTEDFDISRIIMALEIESGERINDRDTLIIFDEIQEVPQALTSLKYFQEDAPQYNIIAAGSYLGIAMHPQTSFPVGKVDFLDIYPLTFIEFLRAMKEDKLVELIEIFDWDMIKVFKSKYINLLRQYFYIGGMPEVVNRFLLSHDYNEVRNIQNNIILTYEQDFSKHAPINEIPRLRMVWNSIPSQLAKENRKFIFGHIRQGARSKDYEVAIQWLIDTGLAHKVNRVNKPGLPLMAYKDINAYKLFLVDIGLMSAMAKLNIKILLDGNAAFEEYKGALTEQYVLQQLKSQKELNIYYWSSESSNSEIDFLIQHQTNVFPLEVKAAENLQAKSLKSFFQKYAPVTSLRTSTSDFRKETWLINIPLFAIGNLASFLSHIFAVK